MALGSGLARQIGYAAETTPGVAATPTDFVPLVDSSLAVGGGRIESDGIIAGARVLRSDQWNGGNFTVGGDVQHELYGRGLGNLLKAAMGSVSTSGGGPTYTHVFTPGDLPTLTAQVGEPGIDGTVFPHTFSGLSVASWEIGAQSGAVGTIGLTFQGMRGEAGSRSVSDGVTTISTANVSSATAAFTDADVGKTITATGIPAGARIVSVTSATAVVISANATATGSALALTVGVPLATATYPTSQKMFKINHLTVSIDGSTVEVESATFAGDNGLADRGPAAGSRWPRQSKEADLRAYTGTLDKEFKDLAMYDRFMSGAEAAVSGVFARGTDMFTIAGNARFDDNPPKGNGRGILSQSVPIKFIASSTDASAMTMTLVNADATP